MRANPVTGGLLALAALLPPTAYAGSAGPAPPSSAVSSHRGAAVSEIPGLAADEIIELREGHGMGQARVAEVQGYPGPRHVLEAWVAGQLPLSTDQATHIQAIADIMARDASRVGGLVLDAERELARAFSSGAISATTLRARVDRIAALRGELRAVHLRAHLETRAALDPAQIARYAELRGYAPAGGPPRHGH
jgi:hypothetical protein